MVLGLEGPGKTKPEVAGKPHSPHWDSSLWQGSVGGSEGEPWVPDQAPKSPLATESPEKPVCVRPR